MKPIKQKHSLSLDEEIVEEIRGLAEDAGR